ncbi:MAG: ribbon-helix-helix domain-containing protein [Oscillospiraceae bacterium]
MAKKDDRIITSIYLTKQMCGEIDKKADREHISRNEQIRRYIEKGLSVDGCTQDVDFIASILRQEMMAIYHPSDIKNLVDKSFDERISGFENSLSKVGKLIAGQFFLLVRLLMDTQGEYAEADLLNKVEVANDLGIQFMKKSNREVNEFLRSGFAVYDTAKDNL